MCRGLQHRSLSRPISGKSQQPYVLTNMAQLLQCILLCWVVPHLWRGPDDWWPCLPSQKGDCKSRCLITQSVLCLIRADHGAGFSLQQSRMRLGNPLACHAFRLPRCRPHAAAQHKPQMVAESGNMKMQPEPDYDADQALTDAGFTPRQARSLVKFMGNVVQPLALESSVLKLETSLKALDFKLSLLLIYFRVEVAANPNVWGWLQPLP